MNRLNRDLYKDQKITKSLVQSVAFNYWIEGNEKAAVYMATGTGKSRLGVLAVQHTLREKLKTDSQEFNVLLVVPTEKLRDDNWKEEFDEWDDQDIWPLLTRTCYHSLTKYKDIHWDLVILDEGHRITENNSDFFFKNNNTIERVLTLTATPPEDKEKREILSTISPCVFIYTLEEAEDDGLVSPFDMYLVKTFLDNQNKIIPAGTKQKRWYQTEKEKYDYLTNKIDELRDALVSRLDELQYEYKTEIDHYIVRNLEKGKEIIPPLSDKETEFYLQVVKIRKSFNKRVEMLILERMHFLQNLPSKTELAKKVLNKIHFGRKKRTLVFSGSIPQVNEVCGKDFVFHSQSNTSKEIREKNTAYDRFRNLEIDLLGTVKSLNEGHSVPLLDQGLIIQLTSKELDIIQRIGRIIRYRLGYTGKIFIIVCWDTVDKNWYNSAIKSFRNKEIKEFDKSFFEK